ncbi:MAG TPA: VOC family protein [Candidatus Thermoplasmatota archaeon]|nr:VOC family protein [Candidatus Thermoplasmatota archaeon]
MAKGLWVVLNVDNVDKSVEFYKMLNLKATRRSEGPISWGEVPAAGTTDAGFILWNKNEIGPGQSQPDLRAWLSGELGKGVVLNFGVPNAQKLWTKVQGLVSVDQPIYEEPWGGHSFSLVDPDGYVVAISDKFPAAAKKPKRAARKVATTARRTAKKVVRGGKRR